jgi:carbamoyltransferase
LFVNSFVGSSFISKNGRIRFDCNNLSHDLLTPVKGYCWIQVNDWEGFEVEAYSVSHEIAHAFSSVPFAGELKENSLLISFDGGSSNGNFAAFHYKDGKIVQLESHWELASLSKLYNDNGLTFGILNAEPGEHCSVPGKLMGYASWGNHSVNIEQWLRKNNYFRDSWGERKEFYQNAKKHFNWVGSLANNNDDFLFNIAATMQEIFRKGILDKISSLANQTKAEYLYYAGGCALNIVANADIISHNWFKDVFISPCCSDSGLSIGASAYWHFLKDQNLTATDPYLNSLGLDQFYSLFNDDIIKTAQALLSKKVIGICNGHSEAGPRALGNRSILSLANSKELSDKVSMQLKEREWYRPVAPIMLEKNAIFFTGLNSIHHLSKYMLLDFEILPEFSTELEGVVHTNGTSRIQTIYNESDNPFIFALLTYLNDNFGVRALVNTSFNGKGEPIVHTCEDAIRSAKNMNLDGLVLNGKYFSL